MREVLGERLHLLTTGRPAGSSDRPCEGFAVKQRRPVPAAKPRRGARVSWGEAVVLRERGPRPVACGRGQGIVLPPDSARTCPFPERARPAARPRVGLWLCAGHFPCPLPSFFFCQLGREQFPFLPAGEMVPCWGFLCESAPPIPLARTGSLQGAGVSLFDPCLGFQAICLLLLDGAPWARGPTLELYEVSSNFEPQF